MLLHYVMLEHDHNVSRRPKAFAGELSTYHRIPFLGGLSHLLREGFKIRRIRELALVRDQNPVFVLGWTLMHVIDETSPLAGETHDSLAAAQGQLVLSLIGIDETTGQDVTARATYQPHALRWNHAFQDVLETDEEGDDVVDFTRFHDVVPLAPAG